MEHIVLNKGTKVWNWCNNNPTKAIIIWGIFVRLTIAFLYGHITLYPDSNDYIILAERLLQFNLSGYEGERPPGYPFVLCLTSISNIGTVIIQFLIGICTLLITYRTFCSAKLRREFALITTLLIASYLPSVFFEFAILTESITLFLITSIFYCFARQIKKSRLHTVYCISISLLCSYLVLTKMFYIYLPILLFIALAFRYKLCIKEFLIRGSSILVIPLLLFFGWSYINKINTGYFTSSTFYGFNIAQNCVNFAEHTTPEYQEIGNIYAKYRDKDTKTKEVAMTIWEAYPELRNNTGLSFPDLSKKLYGYSIATIKKNPSSYLKQVFISWRDFWKTSLYWESYSFSIPQASIPILYICYMERIVLQMVKILFVLLIPYNIVQAIRRREISLQATFTFAIFIASILQAFATYGTNSRFSYPFEILIIISVCLNIREYKNYIYEKRKTVF